MPRVERGYSIWTVCLKACAWPGHSAGPTTQATPWCKELRTGALFRQAAELCPVGPLSSCSADAPQSGARLQGELYIFSTRTLAAGAAAAAHHRWFALQIYSRTPRPGPEFIANLKAQLAELGYPADEIKDTPQARPRPHSPEAPPPARCCCQPAPLCGSNGSKWLSAFGRPCAPTKPSRPGWPCPFTRLFLSPLPWYLQDLDEVPPQQLMAVMNAGMAATPLMPASTPPPVRSRSPLALLEPRYSGGRDAAGPAGSLARVAVAACYVAAQGLDERGEATALGWDSLAPPSGG